MNEGLPGLLTSIEKPTRSGSGSSTSIPMRHIRSPRHSFTASPGTCPALVNALTRQFWKCRSGLRGLAWPPRVPVRAASTSARVTRGLEPSLLFRRENVACCPEAKWVVWARHSDHCSELAHAPPPSHPPPPP